MQNIKNFNNGLFLIALGLIVLVLLFMVITVSRQINDLSNRVDGLATEQRLLNNNLDYQKSLLKPALNIQENTLAFPELKIQIPYDNVSNTLVYNNKFLKDEDTLKYEEGLSVSSTLVGEDPYMAQLSCRQLVRLSFVNGTPYNPWEEYSGEVILEDGRTLYIIKAIAYENNEASSAYCPQTSWSQINPDQVAELFKQARSY